MEDFIRQEAPAVLPAIEAEVAKMEENDRAQLGKGIGVLKKVIDDPTLRLSHSECRRAGDALIAIEGSRQSTTHALSTNARDWRPLSEALNLEFVRPEYQGEKTLS